MKIYVDASLNPKTNRVGLGIISENKRFKRRYACTLDSIFEAEKLGIIQAIKDLRAKGFDLTKVTICSDSLNAVRELEVLNLGVKIEWVSRDFNLAHDIANQARINENTKLITNFKELRRVNQMAVKYRSRMRFEAQKERMKVQMKRQLKEEIKAELKEELRAELKAELLAELLKEKEVVLG